MSAHSFDIADRCFQPGMEQVFIPGTIGFLSKIARNPDSRFEYFNACHSPCSLK